MDAPMIEPSLADRFEAHRDHLRAVALRMLGSAAEADDAVQEAWLRLQRADAAEISNLGGWLTTVVSRLCLDALRTRTARREEPLAPIVTGGAVTDAGPDAERRLADSLGVALLVVLDALGPAERVAFVLHDVFDLPFDDIAAVVGRTPTATRQLASRARRRVQGLAAVTEADRARQRAVVAAFLAAAQGGDFAALLTMLDPDVVLRADPAAVEAAAARAGAPALAPEVRGPREVGEVFRGRARAARPALIDGRAGLAWAPGGDPAALFVFTFASGAGGAITAIDVVTDRAALDEIDVVLG